MRQSTLQGLALVVAVIAVGCGFSPEKKGGGNGGFTGTGGAPDLSGLGGLAGTDFQTGGTGNQSLDGGTFCGQINRPLVALPPDVLIVLDRSGSMDNDINDKGCADGGGMAQGQCGVNSKWGVMTPAIKQVVSATETTVNWGLKYFADPGNSGCNVNNTAAIGITEMNATAVNNSITMQTNAAGGISNGSRTPTRAGITGAVTYLNSLGTTRQNPKFILLATDGLPNCPAQGGDTAADDSTAAIAAVATAFNNGIPTFVVGIATGGWGPRTQPSVRWQRRGATRTSGSPAYYSVASQQALTDALTAIVGKVGGECRFGLGALPSDDGRTSYDAITIFADGAAQNRDTTHANGWDYADASHGSIQLSGQLCQDVMNGVVMNITVAYTCIEP